MKVGYQIKSEIDHNLPVVLVFVSSFCSKCHYTRQLLHKFLDTSEILEVNIAFSDELLEELQPNTVPTIMIVDAEQRIISTLDNIITEHSATILSYLLRNIQSLDTALE